MRLVYVKVTAVPNQTLPKIEIQQLIDNTVVANQDLAPASMNKWSFSFPVPTGTDPKGTYKVIAVADIPSVKDPSAEADLKVIGPSSEGANPGLFGGLFKGKLKEDEIMGKFPGLMSSDEDKLTGAMSDLLCAAYDVDNDFRNIAPFLAKKMAPGQSDRVRSQALSTWGNVLNNKASAADIKALEVMASDTKMSSDMMREVVTVAAKFAEEGAWPLVETLSKHTSPDVRAEMASRLYFDADKDIAERKPLLLAMAADSDALVRAAAVRAFAEFNTDKAVMDKAVAISKSDPSPDVQKAAISAIALSHHHGMKDLVLDTFLTHAQQNNHVSVRIEIADSCHWLPVDAKTAAIVTTLIGDKSVEVRRQMAWQSVNMSEHQELKELFVQAAVSDSDDEVRGNALGGMDRLLGLPEAIAFLKKRLVADATEKTAWACFNVVKFQMEDASARAFMKELTTVPFGRVAQRAREEIASA